MLKNFSATLAAITLSASAAYAVPSLSFIIDGDTFTDPFSFSNTSDAGESLLAFGIDLSGASGVSGVTNDLCFDTVVGGPCRFTGGATAFSATGGTGTSTGLQSSTVVDGGSTLDLTFNDFNPGETFSFVIDVDDADASNSTVLGSDMIGATAYADFSDGQRVLGTFIAVAGNSDASAFSATGTIETPSAIPLPAGLPLLLSGIGGLAWLRRRKRNATNS